MNKTKLTFLSLLALLLPLASCEKNDSSSTSEKTSDSPISDSTSDKESSSTDGKKDDIHTDSRLEVFMFGDLYKDAIRSVYCNMIGVTGDIQWSSSDENVVSIGSNPLNGYMPEVNLIANGYGTATIKAALSSDPTIYTELNVTVSDDYLEMSDELFATVSSSMRMDSVETYYSYDELYNETETGKDSIVTIFEENEDQSNGINDNLTDAYQIKANESDGSVFEKKYVRDGRYLATEYRDFKNEIRKDRLSNSDGETMYWEACPYFNYLGYSSNVNATQFASFDDGKTYHFIGGYETAAQICLNFFQQDISPDDLYFTVKDGKVDTLEVVIDPYKGNTNNTDYLNVKYGMKISSKLSLNGNATIEHLEKYAHEDYHDAISGALTNMASLKNYKSTVSRKLDGSATEKVTYTYTEDTIDIVTSTGNEILSHTGVHKKDDGTYYEYEHDDNSNVTTITKTHNTPFDGTDLSGSKINRYPTFDFAAEIFEKAETDNTYVSRGDNAQFISYCSYLPVTWTLLNSYVGDGTIVLDNANHLTSASAKLTDGENEYNLTIDYSSFGTSVVDIDFSKAVEPAHPTSFEEAYPNLAKEMKAWNIYDAVPFLYYEPGYSESVEMERDSDGNVNCALLRTKMLDDSQSSIVTTFISDYKTLLVENGYTLTSEKDPKGYDLYEKGDYKISIGNELNWDNKSRPAAIIRVFSSKLNPQYGV